MSFELTKNKNTTILIFLKAPRMGHVKTRLAESIGPKSALLVYQTLVSEQLKRLPKDSSVEIHYAPEDAHKEMRDWLGDAYEFRPQCAGGLGKRLEHAVVSAFERGVESVICIGGDCPKLNHVYLEQTAVALEVDYDVVFGPSEDGGYYLIGLNAPYPELFQGIPWSTAKTLNESLKQATKLKLRVLQLETLYDVDEISELARTLDEGLLEIDFT